jgi:Pyruvate/2-oxoacid:ferredoxin oxidoreductase gamma subunit
MVKRRGLVLVDQERVPRPPNGDFALHALPFRELAERLGEARVANLVGLGALTRLGGLCKDASLDRAIRSTSPARFIDLNLDAARVGRGLADSKPSAVTEEIAQGGNPR